MFEENAENLDIIFQLAKENKITRDEFEKCYYGEVSKKYKKMVEQLSNTKKKPYQRYFDKIVDSLAKLDFSLGEKYKNALDLNYEYVETIITRLENFNNISFPNSTEAGDLFGDFRNKIAHGNPLEIQTIHCVLFEVARALIYIMILKKARVEDDVIKQVIPKLF